MIETIVRLLLCYCYAGTLSNQVSNLLESIRKRYCSSIWNSYATIAIIIIIIVFITQLVFSWNSEIVDFSEQQKEWLEFS